MQLHLLTIQQKITYKVLLLTFIVAHINVSKYLFELLVLHKLNQALRSANQTILTQPRSFTFKNIWQSSFCNSLCTSLKNIHQPNIFKRSLETYLFQEAYHHDHGLIVHINESEDKRHKLS